MKGHTFFIRNTSKFYCLIKCSEDEPAKLVDKPVIFFVSILTPVTEHLKHGMLNIYLKAFTLYLKR